jgi:diguanylate cyclase
MDAAESSNGYYHSFEELAEKLAEFMNTILVIEDDKTMCTAIVGILQSANYQTLTASDGRSGLKLAQDFEPDLILCDVMMPDLSGYKVLQQLQLSSVTACIPFIFLTGKVDSKDFRQGMVLGADDYLTKPCTRAELTEAIAARLNKRASFTRPYIEAMKNAAENLTQIAYRDPLTNLPNRILFQQRLQVALEHASELNSPLVVVYLRAQTLKPLDASNSSVTDTLCQALAARLNQKYGQTYTLARLDGTEFGLVVHDITQQQDIVTLAQQMLRLSTVPCTVDDQIWMVQASIGIALYPDNGTTPSELMSHAKIALRQAARQDSNGYQFYNLEIDSLFVQQQQLTQQLKSALSQNEFQLVYQPEVNLITGRIIGAEALLRWHHPEMGIIYPLQFLSIAEETGLIVEIGEWILQMACVQANTWQTPNRPPLRMAVNMSSCQFKQAHLAETIARITQQTGLDPNVLVLEVNEATVMEHYDARLATLEQFRHQGIHINLDNFGTGHSSLSQLQQLPLESIKIDRSLIQPITTNRNAVSLVKAMIAIGQSLNLKVVAEGVETEEQLALLRQLGCYAAQGNLFSRPVSAAQFTEMLLTAQRLPLAPTPA